jgi:hypothetical protein
VLSLPQLQAEIESRAVAHEIPPAYLPTYGSGVGTASSHLEVHGPRSPVAWLGRWLVSWLGEATPRPYAPGYYFVVAERNTELVRRRTQDVDELLYWVFVAAAREYAAHSLAAPHGPADARLAWELAEQRRLLTRLDPAWAARWERERRGPGAPGGVAT